MQVKATTRQVSRFYTVLSVIATVATVLFLWASHSTDAVFAGVIALACVVRAHLIDKRTDVTFIVSSVAVGLMLLAAGTYALQHPVQAPHHGAKVTTVVQSSLLAENRK